MTTPSEPEHAPGEGVDLSKSGASPEPEAPFDPYRFGKPDHPIPAEYAPPGYTGPVMPPATPYGAPPPYGQPPAGPSPYGQAPYGQAPYGQQSYGQPPPYGHQPPGYPGGVPTPPAFHGYVQPRTGNGKATAALVFGILSICFCWLSFLDGLFVILGVVFGIIALNEARAGKPGGRGLATAGLVCAIIGAVLATAITIWAIHAADKCGGLSNSDRPGWNKCIRDHL